MHGFGSWSGAMSLFHIFAYAFEECNCAFCPNVTFCEVFADLYTCFFASIPESFEVEEVLPTSGGQLLCLDGDNLSGSFGSGDGGIVGLEIGEEGLEVSEKNLEGLLGSVVLSFDIGIDLLKDLNFLSVWEVVFGTILSFDSEVFF
ncbi:MAG: hypothetical protein HC936_14915 [Leptolyngbyaceae cyanobacterium SU_3_3]|nr:hypothetical protein [Leptolyngbyaceae cyanobacterium SU_3_3]